GRRLYPDPRGLALYRIVGPVGFFRMPQGTLDCVSRRRRHASLCWPRAARCAMKGSERLEMDNSAIGVKDSLVHRLRDGRVRKDGAHQFDLGGFQGSGDPVALDELGHLGADHMRPEKLASLRIEHRLHQAFGLAHRYGLAVADEGEPADPNLMSGLLCLALGHPDAGDLRPAIGAARDKAGVERMHAVHASNLLHADDPFMAGLVRQPRRTGKIADGIDAVLACP